MTLADYITQTQELVHDTSAVDFTPAEMTAFVNAARLRTAMDLACVRNLLQGSTFIVGQEQYPIFSAVPGCKVLNGGSGYNDAVPPVVTIAAPASGGVQATAVAVSTGGIITQIQMTNWGLGYTSVPAVSIAPPGAGSTATALALTSVNGFDINGIAVLNGNLRYSMSWLPWPAFQAFCRAYTTQFRAPAVWSTLDGINTIFVFPIPDIVYPIDLDVALLPNNLVNTTDTDTQVLLPWSDAVQYYAAYKALLKLQNFEQASYYEKAYERRVGKLIATRNQTARVISQYRNWYRRMARL